MSTNALQTLLRAYIAERDVFYGDATDSEGNCLTADDAAELARMDKIIDDAQAALAQVPSTDELLEALETIARCAHKAHVLCLRPGTSIDDAGEYVSVREFARAAITKAKAGAA